MPTEMLRERERERELKREISRLTILVLRKLYVWLGALFNHLTTGRATLIRQSSNVSPPEEHVLLHIWAFEAMKLPPSPHQFHHGPRHKIHGGSPIKALISKILGLQSIRIPELARAARARSLGSSGDLLKLQKGEVLQDIAWPGGWKCHGALFWW